MKEKMSNGEIDWQAYFEGIRDVCPWSWRAWRKNLIHITDWQGVPRDLGYYQARVWVVTNHNSTELRKLSDKLNSEREDEWLYSHPSHLGRSTPVPVLIQQSTKMLENARKSQGLNK